MAQVIEAEAALQAAARIDAAKALLAVAAEDVRFVGSRARPPTSRAELAAELGRRAAAIQFAPMGGRASDAGDLVWTYGAARWTRDGADQRGHYVRIWRNDRAGWRLLFDELLPASPLKPPPVASPAG